MEFQIVRSTRSILPVALLLAVVGCGNPGAERASSGGDAVTEAAQGPGSEASAAPARTVDLPADAPRLVHVWKSPTCGCCSAWVEHLEEAGFEVEVEETRDLMAVKREHDIAPAHSACHTATVGGYVVEGHVPADVIARMLRDEPDLRGLAVPGMPIGSPGMEQGSRQDPYDVLALGQDGSVSVYAQRPSGR